MICKHYKKCGWPPAADQLKLLPQNSRTRPSQGRSLLILTRHRDKELDSITVAVETELCLSHGAVGNEAAGRFVAVVIAVHVDDSTRAAALSRGW